MAWLLQVLAIGLLFSSTYSAGKCNLNTPPYSWLVTTATGIMKWATVGVPPYGDNFCITGNPTTLVEVDYHIDLGDNATQKSSLVSRHSQKLWDNPDNYCVMDDPQIHVCFPFCSEALQPNVIKAVLASSDPVTVAKAIQKSTGLVDWAITVLQVDFNNPNTHLNVSVFLDPNVWCSVYIGIDPSQGRPYLFEVQLAKVTTYSLNMMDMWALAKEKLKENAEKGATLDERMDERTNDGVARRTATHMVVCGVSQSGKSMMVNKFLDRNEEPKETTALEYIYARRTRGNHKDVCHIWELGGGTKFAQLLAIPLVKRNIEYGFFRATSLVLVLDLTRPNELWITMEQLLTAAGQATESATKELDQHGRDAMKNRVNARMSEYKDDIRMCASFPIPLLIVGSKYDEFQNFDSEQRRKICASLRFLAHYYGAHLMFYSAYNEQLVRVGRSFFSHFAFGTSVPKTKVDDHNKPLYVVCGMDTFESIGPPPIDTASFSRAGQPLHLWKQAFSDHFPQTERETADKSTEEQELFAEPMIDSLIAKREKDLEVYIKQKKDRQAAETRAAEKIRAI